MKINNEDIFSYASAQQYQTSVAYFSMEFAVDQSLKIYSGGLGFLAGSHLRSAYELKQNLIGIGILWKYGYYDQVRDTNAQMKSVFIEKNDSFLLDTDIVFTVTVHNAPVHVKAFLLRPETFGTAPLFLLSTDLPENDEMSRSITHRLYDPNEATRIAQSMILGIGGGMLLDILNLAPSVYHLNEGHAVPLGFYLYARFQSLEELKKRMVFTTHTPEMAGNEEHDFNLLEEMSFFYQMPQQEVKQVLSIDNDRFNYTLAALRFSRKANGVSKLHGEVARKMWGNYYGVCEITAITNAQNKNYWKDPELESALKENDGQKIIFRKKAMKKQLFDIVADQCGKLFDENVLTIVWARRFAAYKRADLLMYDWERFLKLIDNEKYPVQIIWAGKPFPEDATATAIFNQLIDKSRPFANCAVLTGYELALSAKLKKGSDVWLNNPRMYREASGTSGMAAAMNGSLNLTLPDGWVPEFAIDGKNAFVISPAEDHVAADEKDRTENANLMDKLENVVLPMYYDDDDNWLKILKNAATDIVPAFESGRLAKEYYEIMYKS